VVPEYSDMVDEACMGPCIAMELRAENAVSTFRQTAGPWDVDYAKELRPKTIRAMYGKDRVHNAVHCTDLAEDGVLESQWFFEVLA
jgi:nucleoside-diphosphate kinase